tara:strand:- start:7810 stop:8184 length:375 start_codon:yes stop_codon:yes gene_type:complete
MSKYHQRGLSTLGMLAVLAVGGFFLTVAMKAGPLYLDNYFVDAALQSLRNERVHEMTDREIRRKVSDYFTVNNVRDVNVLDLQIEKQKTRTLVKMDYERRVNFMGNVDIVLVFNNQYDSSTQHN